MFRAKRLFIKTFEWERSRRHVQQTAFPELEPKKKYIHRLWALLPKLSFDGLCFRYNDKQLRGPFFSLVCASPDVERLIEVSDHFGASYDKVQALMKYSSGRLTPTAVAQLTKGNKSSSTCIGVSRVTGVLAVPAVIDCNSTLAVCEVNDDIGCLDPTFPLVTQVDLVHSTLGGAITHKCGIQSIKGRLPFGINSLHITCRRSVKRYKSGVVATVPQTLHFQQRVLVLSPVFRYAAALSALDDRLLSGWAGNWTDELELAIAKLMESVKSDGTENWIAEIKCAKASTLEVEVVEYLFRRIAKDAHDVMRNHSPQSMWRLHCALASFTILANQQLAIARVPDLFISAVKGFIQAKIRASETAALIRDLKTLNIAILDHYFELTKNQEKPSTVFVGLARWSQTCMDAHNTGREVMITPEGATIIHSLKLDNHIHQNPSTTAVISRECIANPALLLNRVQSLSETLFADELFIDGVTGYTLSDDNVEESAAIIMNLLAAGVVYAASDSGMLCGHLPMERSMLVLNDPSNTHICADGSGSTSCNSEPNYSSNNVWVDTCTTDESTSATSTTAASAKVNANMHTQFIIPPALRKRSKDMQRVFRNNVKQTLSLRLNSNFDLAMQKLHQHHGEDCWVGPALQKVWKRMAQTSPPQLLIFELWYGEEMIAADFAHPVCGGRSVYVATRFNERSAQYRNLMPGFMLALVMTKYLQELGCCVWDLGPVNLCPLMRYKLDLTGPPLSRPIAQYELLRAHGSKQDGVEGIEMTTSGRCMRSLAAGVLIDEITTAHLLS